MIHEYFCERKTYRFAYFSMEKMSFVFSFLTKMKMSRVELQTKVKTI